MIVDSSVLIEYLRSGSAPSADRIDRELHAGRPICLLPTVLQETLQGARNPAVFLRWSKVLGSFPVLVTASARDTAVAAAGLYARCRWAGFTPRSSNDCLIAVCCIELNQSLLQRDRDFDAIAGIDPRLQLAA
ncbi:MAG TPA: PIN domain-containing protein [Burkholderiaceae bacterium]|nr:PIN domain-containing protein [Burkholderiaceae bacterium]